MNSIGPRRKRIAPALTNEINDIVLRIKGIPRHPKLEDDVTVYAGATILGNITIGAGSVIGANTWVTRDVPRNSKVVSGD